MEKTEEEEEVRRGRGAPLGKGSLHEESFRKGLLIGFVSGVAFGLLALFGGVRKTDSRPESRIYAVSSLRITILPTAGDQPDTLKIDGPLLLTISPAGKGEYIATPGWIAPVGSR